MPKKRAAKGTRKTTSAAGGDLEVQRPAMLAGPPGTKAALAQWVEDLVDEVNEIVGEVEGANERIANKLFAAVYGEDVEAALKVETKWTEAYAQVRDRAGNSLKLLPREVSYAVRIGALNHVADDDAWLEMRWSKKVELLPLAKPGEAEWALFRKGVAHANSPNVGVESLRAWVKNARGEVEGKPGRPPAFTVAGAQKLARTGTRLSSKKERKALAGRIRGAPAPVRDELTRDLRKMLEHLAEVLDLVDSDEG